MVFLEVYSQSIQCPKRPVIKASAVDGQSVWASGSMLVLATLANANTYCL